MGSGRAREPLDLESVTLLQVTPYEQLAAASAEPAGPWCRPGQRIGSDRAAAAGPDLDR